MSALEVLKTVDRLVFQSQNPGAAIQLLEGFLQGADDIPIWYKLARLKMMVGEDMCARAILRNIVQKMPEPHILDVIAAKVPFGRPLVFDESKIVYFGIPKAGSSTIKDALLVSQGRERRGELSHFHTRQWARSVPFAELETKYKDYYSFTVVRHPIARIRSYWTKNIRESRSLVDESRGREVFLGLSTMPEYDEILMKFRHYRAVFRDFQHHTDALPGFIGRKPSRLTQVFGMSGVGEAIAEIEKRTGQTIGFSQSMKSAGRPDISDETKQLEEKVLTQFYSEEMSLGLGDHK